MVPITPLPKIIAIAFTLNFRRRNKPPTNKRASIILKLDSAKLLWSDPNNPNIKIEIPAEAIKATTAGRRADKIVWTPEKFLYL